MNTLTHTSVGVDALCVLPEFVDYRGLRQLFGLSRSHGYSLIERGLVQSVSLRQPGRLRGKRLWVAESVREYLNSCIQEHRPA